MLVIHGSRVSSATRMKIILTAMVTFGPLFMNGIESTLLEEGTCDSCNGTTLRCLNCGGIDADLAKLQPQPDGVRGGLWDRVLLSRIPKRRMERQSRSRSSERVATAVKILRFGVLLRETWNPRSIESKH